MNKKFISWLENSLTKNGKKKLSKSTAKKYCGALKRINKLILNKNINNKPLELMSLKQLEKIKDIILSDCDFLEFDNIGDSMYSNALKRYVCYRIVNENDSLEVLKEDWDEIDEDMNIKETEKLEYKKTRIGQGKYRDNLLKIFNNTCFVTGINLNKVLVASHIKPWYLCKNNEKIDENNGLLLSATIDKLFDCGMITFLENGEILLSDMVSDDQAKKIGISNHKKYDIHFNQQQKNYLKYHNKYKFIDSIINE